MTNVFAVVGEHRNDPDHLLLLGSDGEHYDYSLPTGEARPVQPDAAWQVDSAALERAINAD